MSETKSMLNLAGVCVGNVEFGWGVRGEGVFEGWLATKIADMGALIDAMVKGGWVPVTDDRKPYSVDLLPQVMPAMALRGLTQVPTPVFKVGKTSYVCRSRRVKMDFVATDKPEDLPKVNEQMIEVLVRHFAEIKSTHVHIIYATRQALYGYLPPTVLVISRSAWVKNREAGE